MSEIAKFLEFALADTYVFSLKVQNYHWNVRGKEFFSLHKFFEEMYQELIPAVDTIAERMRALGFAVPASVQSFGSMTSLEEAQGETDGAAMVQKLHEAQDALMVTLQKAREGAENSDDVVTADLMTARLAVHQKNQWMLKSWLTA